MPGEHILVVDDDESIRRLLAMVLVLEGFRVSTAPDAMTGLAVAHDHHPDVIVLDLGLPGGDGFAFLERLRALADLPFIPVIVFSATFDESVKGRAFNAGAQAFLVKPAAPDEVVAEVCRLLAGAMRARPS